MGRPKHNCLYNGKIYEVSELAKLANISHDTMRGRLTRTAELEQRDGKWVFVCVDKHLRPAKPVGRKPKTPKDSSLFTVTRYTPSTDGGKEIMKIAQKSQMWLSRKIRTLEFTEEQDQ